MSDKDKKRAAGKPRDWKDDSPKETITMTKSEIAFLVATIEYMREQQTGRVESVTIPLDPAAGITKAVTKGLKKGAEWVKDNWDKVVVATDLATQFIGGFTAESPAALNDEQRRLVKEFRAALKEDVSLEDLVELRKQLESKDSEDKPC